MARALSSLARLLTALVLALVVSGVLGLILGAAALPVVAGAGLAVKGRADGYLVLPAELPVSPLDQRSEIRAVDGSHLAWLYNENRVPVTLGEVPLSTRQAVVAIEDSRFYEHDGIDLKGTARAALKNGVSGDVQEGGSTLTQQYIKNALLVAATTPEEQAKARERSVERKLQEARYALELERKVSKEEILQRYLNIAYYGNGTYGIGTAASYYFGKPVGELTVAEGALLAGVVRSPGRLDPVTAPAKAVERRNTVLARMAETGVLSEAAAAAAAATPLQLKLSPVGSGCEAPEVTAPFFCDYVLRALTDGPLGAALGKSVEERQQRLLGGGLTIKTTLDPLMQATAQRGLDERIARDDPSGVATTFTSVEPRTGAVPVLAVNRTYSDLKQPGHTKVNLPLGGSSGMQPGSTFKPFVLASALQQGLPLNLSFNSPATYTSTVFKNCNGRDCKDFYEVSNAGDSSAGFHDLVSGTRNSVNTYYLQLLEQTGFDKPAELAEALGLRQFKDGAPTAPLLRGGSLVLGTNEVSPLAMSAAYAAFAGRGLYCPPRPVTEILDPAGQAVALPPQACQQVLTPEIADTVSSVLRGVIEGPQSKTGARAAIGRPAAGKTGSTNGSKAAWFVGYTPQLASAVWVGRPDPIPLQNIRIAGQFYPQVYGGTLPAPIWGQIMGELMRGRPVADLPPLAESQPSISSSTPSTPSTPGERPISPGERATSPGGSGVSPLLVPRGRG